MIRHPLTLEHVAKELSTTLFGATVIESFLQEKNNCTLYFELDNIIRVLSISVDARLGAVIERPNQHRARKNTLDVFSVLLNQKLGLVTKLKHDRVLTFWFEHHQLHVLLFGGGSGNVLCTQDEIVVDALHNKKELLAKPLTLPSSTQQTWNSLPQSTATGKAIGAIDVNASGRIAWRVLETLGIPSTLPISELTIGQRDAITKLSSELIQECRTTTSFVLVDSHPLPELSLLNEPDSIVLERFTSINLAIQRALQQTGKTVSFSDLQQRALKAIQKQITSYQRSIDAMDNDAQLAHRSQKNRLFADILMAQPNAHQTRATILHTTNWEGIAIEIPLIGSKTFVENAQLLYSKARASEEANTIRLLRKPQIEQKLQFAISLRDLILQATTVTELEQLRTKMNTQQQNRTQSQFREFVLDEQHILYVGRSAANNDELTMRFAKQNDWWLHARGVSGSHAVLRGVSEAKPKKNILELAAAITAYYSHARNASYTPVVYTQRKYVRKPKGSNVGAVVLEREEVIMVKPQLPASSIDE